MSKLEKNLDSTTLTRLPRPLVDKLAETRRRVVRVLWFRGCIIVGATALLSLLGIMAIDMVFTILARSVRWLLTLSGMAITAVVAFRYLIRPLSRSFSLESIARLVDSRHPELEERMSSAVELARSEEPEQVRGSERFIEALVCEAVTSAGMVRPTEEFTLRRARPFIVAGATALAILVAGIVVWPRHTLRLLGRAVAPNADIGNVYAGLIRVTPGNVTLLRGSPLRVEVTTPRFLARRVELRRRNADGRETVERMSPEEGVEKDAARFFVSFPGVRESFRYRIRVGSALTEYFEVNVVSPPKVETFSLQYEYPTYTGLPPLTREGLPGDIVAVAGTKVTLTAGFNAKLSVAALVVNGKEITASSDLSHSRSSRKQWSLVLEPGLEGTWSFRLRDEFGFENEPLEYRIQALPDRPPTISIIEPDRQNLRLRPTDRLPLAYVVNDDFGIGTVEMLADLQNNGEFKPFLSQLPFQEAEQKGEFVGQTVLDLGTVDLKGARTFKLQLRVRDTLPPEQNGPQLALSRPITINIDLSAPSLAEQELGLQQHHIARTLEEARKELVAARQDAQEAVGQIREKSEITEVAATKLESVRERSAGTEERLRQLAEAVRQSAYAQMADEIRAVPDRAIQPAREAAGMIPLAGNDGERGQYAQAMLQNLERAIGELNRLQDELKELRTRLAVAAAVADLAERQTELAREAAQLASAGAATIPQNWQAREQQVVGDLAPLVRGSQEALQSAFEDARERTGGLLAAARRLAAEQQRTAAAVQQLQGAAGNAEQFAETARQIATEFGSEPRDGVNPESVLAQHQEGLAREAGNLAEATRGLGEALRNLGQSEPLQQAARSSEQAFGNAQSRMNEAARSLASTAAARAQGQPLAEGERANLAAMQASASQAAQQAVGALENLERSLAAAMARLPEQTQPADEMLDGAELARALREASAAAQFAQSSARSTASSQSGQPHAATGQTGQAEPALRGQSTGQAAVHEAARAAQQAAAALQTAAAQAAGNTGVPMQNMAFHSDQQGTMLAFTHNPFSVSRGGFGSDPEAERRRPPPPEFGIAGSDWVKLKGALESEVAKAAADTVPKDYRELVKQYFRELSRRGVLRARKE